MIGLLTTCAGTPYIPDVMGWEWHMIEGDATMIKGVYHCIDLISHNRKEDIWHTTTCSAYEFQCTTEPCSKVIIYFIHLNEL